MSTTSKLQVTEGSGKNVATYSVTEDAVTKEIQRVVISDSAGVERGNIKDTFAADTALTITLASLANSAAGVGRQSTLIDNSTSRYSSALIFAKITVGTSPTANTPIYVYLVRDNADGTTPVADDSAGASDAGITINNAQLLGTILCTATTSNAAYSASFDTSLLGPLGPKWGIAIVNNTGVALNSTGSNHAVTAVGLTKAS